MSGRAGRGRTLTGLALATFLLSRPVAGQSATDNVAAAEALFQEAVRLIEGGQAAEACPKFAESHRLDPQGGAAFELASCYEQIRKLGSAWAAFNEAAARWRLQSDKREGEARKRADALEPRLSRLAIVVPSPARIQGLSVKRNGTEVGAAQWGVPVPLDSGEVVLEATAPGHEAWKRTILLDRPGVTNAEVPVLVKAKEDGSSGQPKTPEIPFWNGQRIGAATVAGLGVVGLLIGVATGAAAAAKKPEMEENCVPGNLRRCNHEGLAAYDDLKTLGDASTATLIAGGLLASAGVVLWLTTPSAKPATNAASRPAVRVNVGSSGVSFRASW